MRTPIKRFLSLMPVLFLLVSSVAPVIAATYRPGAQSGPSVSYVEGMYYSNYTRVPITGDNRTDLVAIALSQLGYQEGSSNENFSGEVSGQANYVEFSYNTGDLGLGYGGSDYPWCASFVSWCLYQSHCTDQDTYNDLGRFHSGDAQYIWKEISCSRWASQLKAFGYYRHSAYQGGNYTPKSGDLVFFQNSGGVVHVGICLYTDNGRIYTIEGNTSDSAGLVTNGGGVYFKNYSLSTSSINGYGVLPYKSKSVAKIDYSCTTPTPGLYVANTAKYIYASETANSHSWVLDRFTMFEVTRVCSNGRLEVNAMDRSGTNVTGYISNNSDRVIQLSATAANSKETARTILQEVVRDTQKIRHYHYSEEAILQIRNTYRDAVALVNNSSATEAQLIASADTLRDQISNVGPNTIADNNQGIYINGRNSVIRDGDCFIYTPTWNNGLITVENANIRYTLNVICEWDSERQIHVIKSITQGNGSATPAIQLGADDFLIACHDWEIGISSGDDPVEYSGTNYQILSSLKVGDGVKLSGANALNANQDVEPAAYLKFIPKEAVQMTGENVFVGHGDAVLFTPDFNGGILTAANANIGNTLNIMAQWDAVSSAWVVTDKFVGTSSHITITDGQILIACHVGDTTGQAYNYNRLHAAKIGQQLVFYGISPTDGRNQHSISASISFQDLITPVLDTEEVIVPVNLSRGIGAASRKPGTAVHTANLTDGIYTDALDSAGGWFGFLNVPDSINCNTDENGVGCVTLDLEQACLIHTLRAHLYAGSNSADIGTPEYIHVYTSNDGNEFVYVGDLDLAADASASYWADLEKVNVTGRYVRFDIGPSKDAAWVFLNELEVLGYELTGAENLALGKELVVKGYEDSPFTALLNDGLASDLFRHNVNDSAWFAFRNPENVTIHDTMTGEGCGIITIDLGGPAEITDLNIHLFGGVNDAEAVQPKYINTYYSTDGSFFEFHETIKPDKTKNEAYWMTADYTADPITARYVKLEAGLEAGQLVLLNEIRIGGLMLSPDASGAPGSLSDVVLTGDFHNRNMLVVDEQKVTTTIALEAGSYNFQVLYNTKHFGSDNTIHETTGDTPLSMNNTAESCTIHVSRSGDYVFTFDRKTRELVVACIPDTLYLRGSFNNWGTMLPMTDNGDGTYSTTIALTAGDHTFSVANEDYSSQWPSDPYKLHLECASTVSVTLNSSGNILTVNNIENESKHHTSRLFPEPQ